MSGINLWGGALFAAIASPVSYVYRDALFLRSDAPYINAGFLLVNCKVLRAVNWIDEAKKFISLFHGAVYNNDEGVINALGVDHIDLLPPRYNVRSFNFEYKPKDMRRLYPQLNMYSELEFEEARHNPAFVHFSAGPLQRPWNVGCMHPLRQLWLDRALSIGCDPEDFMIYKPVSLGHKVLEKLYRFLPMPIFLPLFRCQIDLHIKWQEEEYSAWRNWLARYSSDSVDS